MVFAAGAGGVYNPPMHRVYVILGCTACGKGSVGRELARRAGGRILSVDSMKVYRRMDIGTAKPSAEFRAEIPHYAVDVVEPTESFSVARYLEVADEAIERTRAEGALPLAVGGTSLYLKALAEGLFEGPSADPSVRQELKQRAGLEGSAALHAELARVDATSAGRIHPNDTRRIVRALEVYRTTGLPISEHQRQWDSPRGRHELVLVGLRREREDQNRRINARVRRMVELGLVEEVRRLLDEPGGIGQQAAQAVGYAELIEHFRGGVPLDEALERIKINTRRLAKKQRTWQRRFAGVRWFDLAPEESAEQTAGRIAEEIDLR